MTKSISIFVAVAVGGALVGCGDDGIGNEDDDELTRLYGGNLDAEALDWVVEGMRCEGESVTRFVGLVDEEDDDGQIQRRARYLRGDDCVDVGELFWDELPTQNGQSVSVLVDSADETWREVQIEAEGDDAFRLVGDEEIWMRQVARQTNPTPVPDLEDFDLDGQWWMEGYPCIEEQVPQLVRVLHPPGSIQITKVVGDECIGDGVQFVEHADVEGTSLDGEAWMEEPPEFPDPEDDDLRSLSGTVHTEDFIRLVVVEQAVSLRRVLADSKE